MAGQKMQNIDIEHLVPKVNLFSAESVQPRYVESSSNTKTKSIQNV